VEKIQKNVTSSSQAKNEISDEGMIKKGPRIGIGIVLGYSRFSDKNYDLPPIIVPPPELESQLQKSLGPMVCTSKNYEVEIDYIPFSSSQ
jgi:hypothetical protein